MTEPVFSPALPEPTFCLIVDPDGDCENYIVNPDLECTCRDSCGEGSEAGCCVCIHADIYEPCPRGGYWCDGPGGCNNGDESCCTPEQSAFAQAAYAAQRKAKP